jgi:hypothetical protein
VGTYYLGDLLVHSHEISNVTVDIDEALKQPEHVVPIVNEIDPRLLHLYKSNTLEVQRMVAHKVEDQKDIAYGSQEHISHRFLRVILQPIHDPFYEWEGLSKSKNFPSERHVALQLLEPLSRILVLCSSGCNDRYNELDEVLYKTTSLVSA